MLPKRASSMSVLPLICHITGQFFNRLDETVSITTQRDMGKTLTSNDTVDGYVNRRGIAGSVTEQVNVCATQLLDLGKPRHASVVLQLLLPVWLLRHPVGHRGSHEAGRDAVDANAVLCPFHGERVGHVADAGLGCTVGSRRHALSWTWSANERQRDLRRRFGVVTYLIRPV